MPKKSQINEYSDGFDNGKLEPTYWLWFVVRFLLGESFHFPFTCNHIYGRWCWRGELRGCEILQRTY